MNEFENLNQNEEQNEGEETRAPELENSESAYEEIPQPSSFEMPQESIENDQYATLEKINYTPTKPIKDYKPMSKGMRAFCAALAAIILLTGIGTAGYFFGRNSVASSKKGPNVTVELSKKPTNAAALSTVEVYEAANESIVGIRVYNANGAGDASGVIYSKDGYIVTNDHIYSEISAPKFRVYLHDGSEYDARYIAGDAISDLAILKIEGAKNLKVADFGDSRELVCGEDVVAMGRPNDATDNTSITSGIISLTSRRVKTTSSYSSRLIQTDSAINPGSSGGALLNMFGQVVGITSSKLAGVEYDAIGFAIPTTTVKRVAEQLISSGKVTDRAKLGITYTEINSVTEKMGNYKSTGLYIVSVGEDSDIFGKVSEGDIITHVNGQKINNDEVVLNVIEDSKAGDRITLTILSKNGKQQDYNVVLKANIGESSYTENEIQNDNSSGGGTFDFPFGE